MSVDSQLSNSLNDILSSNFSIKKRSFVNSKKRIYNQMFINENLTFLRRLKSLCFFRFF